MTQELLADLPPDLRALRSQLVSAAERDLARRHRRRHAAKAPAVGALAAIGLVGTTVAAGAALGVIDLGNGIQAKQVSSVPAYDAATHQFVQVHGDYVYHLTGGASNLSGCPGAANNIYVEATRPLDAAELRTASEMATGAIKAVPPGPVPGVKSVSDGCPNAGVELVVGASPHAPGVRLPTPSQKPTLSKRSAEASLRADGGRRGR
jgi:hypothetical protein